MSNTATVSGKIGPGNTVTSLVLHNVRSITFDEGGDGLTGQTITVVCDEGTPIFSLYEVTTVTYTVSSHNATITIS